MSFLHGDKFKRFRFTSFRVTAALFQSSDTQLRNCTAHVPVVGGPDGGDAADDTGAAGGACEFAVAVAGDSNSRSHIGRTGTGHDCSHSCRTDVCILGGGRGRGGKQAVPPSRMESGVWVRALTRTRQRVIYLAGAWVRCLTRT